jgi:surface antigen
LPKGSRLQKTFRRKSVRRRAIRYSLVAANVAVLLVVIGFVASSARQKNDKDIIITHAVGSVQAAAADPIDRLTAYDVAANIAQATRLTEATPIVNQAQSAKVAVVMSASDTNIAAKPQVVSTALKSWRDIQDYKVVEGDTASSVAQKFGITTDSLKWSNNLPGDAVTVGSTLMVPPVNGIAVTVKAGDTPQSLATKYNANVDQISQYNDAEKSGLVVGRRAIIPDGKIIAAAPARTTTTTRSSATIVSGSSSFTPRYGANGYDYGWCTYYAAARSGAPGNWGNANTWAYYARLSGWNVSGTPSAGAIFQTPAGWAGHVGIVEEVYDNGTMKVSDMNGFAGFGRVGYAVVSVNAYPNYITR